MFALPMLSSFPMGKHSPTIMPRFAITFGPISKNRELLLIPFLTFPLRLPYLKTHSSWEWLTNCKNITPNLSC